MENKIYCTSIDEEIFSREEFDTQEEAVAYMNNDLHAGDTFYVGIKDPITIDDVRRCCYSIVDNDMLAEAMMEEVGDVAEDWLCNIDHKEWDELHKIMADWLWKKDKPTFYRVIDVEKFIAKK